MSAAHRGRGRLVGAIRIGSAAVVVATSVAVTMLCVHRSDTLTVPREQSLAGPALVPTVPTVPAVPRTVPPALAARPLAGPAAAVAISPHGRVGAAKPVPVSGPSGAAGTAVPLAPGLAAALDTGDTPQPPCPLGWPAPPPAQQGGLASLIGLAPLAGPFSSEAFALGSVYQPILRLVGPLLAQIQPLLAFYQPAINPLITQVQGVEAAVLQAILPFYGPYRQQLIAAEGGLAATLAPILESAYHSPAASCLVAWEGQQIAAAKGGPMTVASLNMPGTVVVLRPTRSHR